MPVINGYYPVSRDYCGFLLPIGRDRTASNQDLIQKINGSGVVEDFFATISPCIEILHSLRQWKKDGLFDAFPLLIYEVEYFIQDAYVDIHKSARRAFEDLRKISEQCASIWRDTEIFLPAVREDVVRHHRNRRELRADVAKIEIVTVGDFAKIYLPERLYSENLSLPNWDYMRINWKINQYSIEVKRPPKAASTPFASWILLGQGPVGRKIVSSQSESQVTFGQEKGIAIATGRGYSASDQKHQIVVTILSGNLGEVRAAESASLSLRHKNNVSHAVFVRPFGFGVPSQARASTREIHRSLSAFSYFWSIHRHRNIQSAGSSPRLAALHRANRNAAAVSTVLLEFPDFKWNETRRTERRPVALGATGISRFISNNDFSRNLKIAVGALLDPEIRPTHDTEVYCFVPKGYQTGDYSVDLGKVTYDVRLIERKTSRRLQEVVLFATNMDFADDMREWYFNFCVSLVQSFIEVSRVVHLEFFEIMINGSNFRICPIFDRAERFNIKITPRSARSYTIYLMRSTITNRVERDQLFRIGLFHYTNPRCA